MLRSMRTTLNTHIKNEVVWISNSRGVERDVGSWKMKFSKISRKYHKNQVLALLAFYFFNHINKNATNPTLPIDLRHNIKIQLDNNANMYSLVLEMLPKFTTNVKQKYHSLKFNATLILYHIFNVKFAQIQIRGIFGTASFQKSCIISEAYIS